MEDEHGRRRFTIEWGPDIGREAGYFVSIPNLGSTEVIEAEAFDRLASLNALLVEALELARQHLTHGVSTLREFCNWGPGCPACAVEDALARVREGGA